MTIINELVGIISLQVDNQKFQNADAKFKQVKQSFIGIKTQVALATAAIIAFERSIAMSGTRLSNTAKDLNISTDQFQILDFAAKLTGGSIETLGGAISGLQSQLDGFRVGKGISEDLMRGLANLGIDPTQYKSGLELAEDAAERLKKINDPNLKNAIGNNIFGNGYKEIERIFDARSRSEKELRGNNLLLSPEKIKQLEEVNAKFALMGQTFKNTFMEIAVALKPVFDEITRKVVELTPEIKKLTQEFGAWLTDPKTAEGLKKLIDGLGAVANLLIKIAAFSAKTAATVPEALNQLTPKTIGENITEAGSENALTPLGKKVFGGLYKLNGSSIAGIEAEKAFNNAVGIIKSRSALSSDNNTNNSNSDNSQSTVINNNTTNQQNTTQISIMTPNNLLSQFAFGRVF